MRPERGAAIGATKSRVAHCWEWTGKLTKHRGGGPETRAARRCAVPSAAAATTAMRSARKGRTRRLPRPRTMPGKPA